MAYRYFHFNVHQDIDQLCTMYRVNQPLYVAADGDSIRTYRAYYDRNLIPLPQIWQRGRRFAVASPNRTYTKSLSSAS